MSETPVRRPARRRAAVVNAAPVTEEREPRGARRKRETRTRLLEAALKLMAEKGMEGVAINEITETADVGFGSFYNHFESKEAIYLALTDWVFEDFGDMLDRLTSGITDPAEVIAVSVRHTLLRARKEPVWGQFLIREGFSPRVLSQGLGQRLLRDIHRGTSAQRLTVLDPLMSLVSVGGTVLAAIAASAQLDTSLEPTTSLLQDLGFNADHFPERVASTVLATLGISRADADEVARRPLPDVQSELAVS